MDFRSEKIKLCQLIVHKEAAFPCVVELGRQTLVQFKDLNDSLSVFHRTHIHEIRRFTELERSLRYLETEIVEAGARSHIPYIDTYNTEIIPQRVIYDLETRILELEKEVRQFLTNGSKIHINYNRAREFRHVLQKVEAFFEVHLEDKAFNLLESGTGVNDVNEFGTPLTPLIDQNSTPWFVSGMIESAKRVSFERVLWRACRRTAFVRTADIDEMFEDSITGKPVEKCAFIIFFKGEKLQDIVNRVCEGGNFVIAECWVPDVHFESVKEALQRGSANSGTTIRPIINILSTNETPPTYNRVNKFTAVFQSIVDSYGTACYREMNPAPYIIITFPFLFAVMFGDVGHGLVLVLAALAFIYYEKMILSRRIRDEIFGAFFGGRYIILLMGLFSLYTGAIYNDAFSKSFNIFGSGWVNPYRRQDLKSWENTSFLPQLDPVTSFKHEQGPYPFGLDPVWNFSVNRLNYINSMKMKASIIIGIAQMVLGVLLSFFNHKHKSSYVDIFTNFIPQLVFLSVIFVYLCIQIVAKWIYYWVVPDVVFGYNYPGSHCAPSLLIGLINMFMFKPRAPQFTNVTVLENETLSAEYPQCHLAQWYPNQQFVESILVAIAFICVPIMLFGKPICNKIFHRKKPRLVVHRKPQMGFKVQIESEEIELIPATNDLKNGKIIETPVEVEEDEH
uniref:V-type proton ATPase subunit a n=1 Tax=Panagrolaimus sp. ES5 TaxID=591445 RepID=A0AC34GPR7_9BILA